MKPEPFFTSCVIAANNLSGVLEMLLAEAIGGVLMVYVIGPIIVKLSKLREDRASLERKNKHED